MSDAPFAIRALAPDDGPALDRLADESPDTGQIAFALRYHLDPYRGIQALHPDTTGAIAQEPNTGHVVGAGLVHFGVCRFENALRPYAMLFSLKVHPDFRRRGIATQLARWRIQSARERIGDDGVILAMIQKNNDGSLANARKWCRQIVGTLRGTVLPMRTTVPPPHRGITIRAAEPTEIDEYARQRDAFYKPFNLYAPQTGASLAETLGHSPFADPIRHIRVAADRSGSLLAGAEVVEEFRVRTLHVVRMPPTMRWVSRRIGLLPPDGVMRELRAENVWFAPGQIAAARRLRETLRWEWQGRASVVEAFYDPRSSELSALLRQAPWMPGPTTTLAIHGPVPMRDDGCICPVL